MYATTSFSQPQCLAQFFLRDGLVLAEDQHGGFTKYVDLQGVVGANLNDGYASFVSKDETFDEHLHPILKMCPLSELQQSHVVTWRGVLTQVMCFPYSHRNDDATVVNCVFKDGVLYIEHDKESQLQRRSDPRFTYFGHRFETICLSSCKTRQKESITSNKLQWCHIYSASLNGTRLVFGAEVDGLDEHEDGLVELKTSKEISTGNDHRVFVDKKLARTWAQSFLANVPTIIYGFRDAKGIVKRVERFSTSSLPKMATKRASWDPQHMLSFLYNFLTDLQERCSRRPGRVFQVVLDPIDRLQRFSETDKPSFV